METAELISKTMELLSKFFNEYWSKYSIKRLNKLIEAAVTKDTADLLEAWEELTGENIWDEAIQEHRDDTGCRCGE